MGSSISAKRNAIRIDYTKPVHKVDANADAL
jgi:hypothetical protein